MPHYLVERTFQRGIALPEGELITGLISACQDFTANNALVDDVTWLHSYVVMEERKSFFNCDAHSPEAVRRAAQRNGLPVDRIIEVRFILGEL